MRTHTIEIPPDLGGGTVEIRAKLGWADRARLEGKGVRFIPKPGASLDNISADTVDIQWEPFAQGLAKLEAYVVRWGFVDEAGQPIPVSAAGFRHPDLDPDAIDYVLEQADEYYESRRRTKSGAAGPGPALGRGAGDGHAP